MMNINGGLQDASFFVVDLSAAQCKISSSEYRIYSTQPKDLSFIVPGIIFRKPRRLVSSCSDTSRR
jgi:hypothetical protein